MWQLSFSWFLRESVRAGLVVNPARLETTVPQTPGDVWADKKHESLTLKWYPAELVPKLRWSYGFRMRVPDIGRWRRRFVHDGALIDESALRRIRETAYAPQNLASSFLATVRTLPDVTGPIPVTR